LRRRLIHIIRDEHTSSNTVGIFDETSDVKKGDKTPGVQRQWCGKVGKNENCMVTVHLCAATEDFHCMLDGELFLPESWSNDRDRCRAAGIPDDMVYRPKWQIALEVYDRSMAEGMAFAWVTADEGYGGKPAFLEGLEARNQRFVLEVPRNFSVWESPPEVTEQGYRKGGRGRGRKTPRVKSGQSTPRSVDEVLWFSEGMKSQNWTKFRIKESEKGPVVWEAKRIRVTLKGSDGLPGMRLWLVAARNVLDGELKFFVSNAGEETSLALLLLVAFQRWRVEKCFEDQKQEVGLDCFEGRRYLGLKRHLIMTAISYLFISRVCEEERKKKSGMDNPAGARRHRRDCDQLEFVG
jgi:SRSO17 transposase